MISFLDWVLLIVGILVFAAVTDEIDSIDRERIARAAFKRPLANIPGRFRFYRIFLKRKEK